MSGVSDLFNGSTIDKLILRARARRLSGCHRQGQAGSGMGAATAAHRWLVLAAPMVIRWSMDLDVIFIMFEVLCTFG